MFRFMSSTAALLLASVLSACAGSGGSRDLPRTPSTAVQSGPSDTQVTVTTTKTAVLFHVTIGTAQKFRAANSVGRAGEIVKGLRVMGKLHDYWFGEDAKMTRYAQYIIIRGYGRTFVFKKSDVRVIDNEIGQEKNAVPDERGIPVASSLASGHVHQAAPAAACPDCVVLTHPSSQAGQSQRSTGRQSSVFKRACDSTIDGSCDYCTADPFFTDGCCDVASLDPCNVVGSDGGYYDPYGNWIPDPCGNYLWDVSYYAECQALNEGQLAVIPLMRAFRSPGVQHYNWYFDGYTVMDVLRPPNGSTGSTWSWSFNDLFKGRIFLENLPFDPAKAALGEWCFYLNNTSAYSNSTAWVKNFGGGEVGAWSATLATITGVTNPDRCPI